MDSENVRGNGFVARGVCARYEITFNEDENTTADLLDGKITFHQYITPVHPLRRTSRTSSSLTPTLFLLR